LLNITHHAIRTTQHAPRTTNENTVDFDVRPLPFISS
jgi:hypothetical protein